MIYSNNTNNIMLLEAELKRLKDLYTERLKKKDELYTLKELRTMIKLISARIVSANNPTTPVDN